MVGRGYGPLMSITRHPSAPLVAALFVVGCSSPAALVAQAPESPSAQPITLDVMTFNIRTAIGRDGDNVWPNRKELVAETIGRFDPHVFGLQEALSEQIDFLKAEMPQYRWAGVARGLNGGTGLSEATPIFYRYRELVPIESGTFWLSENQGPPRRRRRVSRIVTWARFHHLETGRQIYVYNTHFTLRRGPRQVQAAAQINARIAELPPGSAVIVMGDFNAVAESSETWLVATSQGLRDAWLIAGERHGPALTSSGFAPPPEDREGRIDWVLVGGSITVRSIATVVHQRRRPLPIGPLPGRGGPPGPAELGTTATLRPSLHAPAWQLRRSGSCDDAPLTTTRPAGAPPGPPTDRAAPRRRPSTPSYSTIWRRSRLKPPRPTPWARACPRGSSVTSGATCGAASSPTGSLGRGARTAATNGSSLSCKSRGACPSCNARRMCEVAAHLTDHVLPHLPARQWLLSVPKRLRPYLHHDANVAGAVLRVFLRAIRTTLCRTSPGAPPGRPARGRQFLPPLRLKPQRSPSLPYMAAPSERPRSRRSPDPGLSDIRDAQMPGPARPARGTCTA